MDFKESPRKHTGRTSVIISKWIYDGNLTRMQVYDWLLGRPRGFADAGFAFGRSRAGGFERVGFACRDSGGGRCG
jgi:hypothetical protein